MKQVRKEKKKGKNACMIKKNEGLGKSTLVPREKKQTEGFLDRKSVVAEKEEEQQESTETHFIGKFHNGHYIGTD